MGDGSRSVLWKRLMVAGLAGVLVAGVCLHFSWEALSATLRGRQRVTLRFIELTEADIREYRRQEGRLPRSLKEVADHSSSEWVGQNGVVRDAWEHPLVYRVRGDRYTLLSLGQDGRPGGVGLDVDVSVDRVPSRRATLTWLQVLLQPSSQGVVRASLFFGLLTFGMIFWMVRERDFWPGEVSVLVGKLFFTLVATVMVAMFMTVVHVQSGH